MASRNHVSKRKPSSSSSHHTKKPKLSKKSKSSEEKKRKRSRISKREKSRKLLRRRDASVSSSDSEDDSLSVSPSSDSEDDYRRRKGRSRTRGDSKRSKKRVRRSSSRSESPLPKKRKGLKKTDGVKLKKHSHRDKVRKTSVSVDVSSGSDDSKSLRIRDNVKEEVKKSGNEVRYKYRSMSPCSDGSEKSYYDHREERLVSENYAGRLRSVLTFPDRVEEDDGGRYQSKDENKAEFIHAYDDSPPCKSNDSYEVGRKREASHHDGMVEDGRRKNAQTNYRDKENAVMSAANVVEMVEGQRRKEFSHQMKTVPEKKTQVHDGNAEDAFMSKSRMIQSTKEVKGDGVVPSGGMNQTANMESSKATNKREVPSSIVSSELSDLESILRQKALENFRKFRGGCQPNTASSDQKNGNGVNQPSISKDETVKEVDSNTTRANNTNASVMKHSNMPVMEGIAATKSPIKGVQVPDCNTKRLESHETVQATHPSVRWTPEGNSKRLESDDSMRATRPSVWTRDGNSKRSDSNDTLRATHPSVRGTPDGIIKRLDTRDTVHASNPSELSDKSVSNRLVDTKATEKRIINLGGVRKFNQGSLVYKRQASQDPSDGKAQETKSMLNRVVSEPPKAARESCNLHKPAISETILCSAPATGEQVTTESGNAAKGSSETKDILNGSVHSPPKAAVGSDDPQKSNKSPPGSAAASEATSLPNPVIVKHFPTESGIADNGSEFKQKTMSVMRGGEMVQVSYKVYIPQKPPALARRQLRR